MSFALSIIVVETMKYAGAHVEMNFRKMTELLNAECSVQLVCGERFKAIERQRVALQHVQQQAI
eukprot:NODE_27154_length_523_cov_3.856061.p3 GENE.NODE_27154_length_523_cov_3.856061~~NODE_27154_length_523_cov_3.856061.p3  ORF type:complete len:64 (+),score=24.08 NODE_27154_length_523_cov_3.856061:181-372(+)